MQYPTLNQTSLDQPGCPTYLGSRENTPRLKSLGYHSLDEDSEQCCTPNSVRQFVNLSTPTFPTSGGITSSHSPLNSDPDAPQPSTSNREAKRVQPIATYAPNIPELHAQCEFLNFHFLGIRHIALVGKAPDRWENGKVGGQKHIISEMHVATEELEVD
nr:hypothetical protein HmN_000698500 [Hymenolepis microstoma]